GNGLQPGVETVTAEPIDRRLDDPLAGLFGSHRQWCTSMGVFVSRGGFSGSHRVLLDLPGRGRFPFQKFKVRVNAREEPESFDLEAIGTSSRKGFFKRRPGDQMTFAFRRYDFGPYAATGTAGKLVHRRS